ncbi:MAG: endonuclease/exonuclease/phosphatase family protein [Anaerolineae bacterium]|nr:endonuclease/exonuclease/phosphatase family protein [Thermoflexales bacterium]MDW8406866.1 endonuclease/exonuclease/phosphatase family protein [Anaerolineae bacterium]
MDDQSASEHSTTSRPTAPSGALRTRRRSWVEASAILTAGYGLSTAALLGLDQLAGEELPVIGLFNTLLPAFLLPALILAVLWLGARRWKLALLLTPAIATLVTGYGALFLPRSAPLPAGPQFSVLTFNLHAERVALTPLLDVIRAADADIVALQELSPEAAQVFRTHLGDRYPYQALHLHPINPVMGQGILSKAPVRDSMYWRVEMWHQRAVVTVHGIEVAVYNVHPHIPFVRGPNGLAFDAGRRERDIADILRRAERENKPVILAGDFNMSDRSAHYRLVTARYRDAFRETGWGFGFTFPDFSSPTAAPRGLPRMTLPVPLLTRIDYVFYSDHFQAVETRVWPSAGGSDHRPVLARLALAQ